MASQLRIGESSKSLEMVSLQIIAKGDCMIKGFKMESKTSLSPSNVKRSRFKMWQAYMEGLIKYIIHMRTNNESTLVGIKIILKTIIKVKANEFIHVDVARFATMPSGFNKASIKTWKNNECFSHGPLQGVTSSCLIS